METNRKIRKVSILDSDCFAITIIKSVLNIKYSKKIKFVITRSIAILTASQYQSIIETLLMLNKYNENGNCGIHSILNRYS